MNKEELFYKKIIYIYKKIYNEDIDSFTKDFDNKKTSFKNRKIYLSSKWLKNHTYPRNFIKEFKVYPFSKLTLYETPIFRDANDFLDMSLENFQDRVDKYCQFKSKEVLDIEKLYKYIYLPNFIDNDFFIDYYTIEHNLDKVGAIKVTPPAKKAYLNIQEYYGKYIQHQNILFILFSNNSDYMGFVFNLEFDIKTSRYIVGVAIGIADRNSKIPIAKKAIISKDKLSNIEIENLYKTLNETEIISTKENLLFIDNKDKNHSFLENYYDKVYRIKRLLNNLQKNNQFFNRYYYKLLFKEFSSVEQMFKKAIKNQVYYLYNRESILKELFNSFKLNPYSELKIVIPIYQYNIFATQSKAFFDIQAKLLELSKSVKIEMIFIIDKCKDSYDIEFENFLNKVKDTIKVFFVLKSKIINSVNSYDFVFTNRRDFVIVKWLRVDSPIFNIYVQMPTILEFEAIFRKIKNRAINLNNFIKEKKQLCLNKEPKIEALLGKWYLYIYGSRRFWIDVIEFRDDYSVILSSEGKVTDIGEIIVKKRQNIILLEDLETSNIITIVFDNSIDNLKHAFLVKVTGKAYKSENDILSFAIISKKEIEENEVKKILGEKEQSILYPKGAIKERLNLYLINKFGYY